MNLNDLFQQQGLGIMATSSKDGSVNTAVYARPHLIDEKTMVWGMSEGRTFRNIIENPHASFLFKASGPGFTGIRLCMELVKTENSGPMLTEIKQNADAIVGPGTGVAITYATWFNITEIRPLI